MVTNDLAFYEERDLKRGLSPNLKAELGGIASRLSIKPKLSELLEEIRTEYDIDPRIISEYLANNSGERLTRWLVEKGFQLGNFVEVKRRIFATENPRVVFVEFEVTYRCPDNTGNRDDAILIIQGDGTYDAEERRFRAQRTISEAISFRDGDGTEQDAQNLFASAEVFLGPGKSHTPFATLSVNRQSPFVRPHHALAHTWVQCCRHCVGRSRCRILVYREGREAASCPQHRHLRETRRIVGLSSPPEVIR